MPQRDALEEVCQLRRAHGYETSHDDLQLGVSPGHLLDDSPVENANTLKLLLTSMLRGHLEGVAATKGGRVIATVGCGIIEISTRDKSVSSRLRNIVAELGLEAP
jgi:hypothetical protein